MGDDFEGEDANGNARGNVDDCVANPFYTAPRPQPDPLGVYKIRFYLNSCNRI